MMKKVISFLLAVVMLIGMLPMAALKVYAMSVSEVNNQIVSTYKSACTKAGVSSFNGYCAWFVNWELVLLGINQSYVGGNGNDEYDNYKNMEKTSGGYNVTAYPASSYSLQNALNAISNNGTKNVTNILVGFQTGSGSDGALYGHVVFIHAIIDGIVYFSESFNMTIGGKYYAEGSVVSCNISTFASYYNSWTTLDGVIHFHTCAHTYKGLGVCSKTDCGYVFPWESTFNPGDAGIYKFTKSFTPRWDMPYDDATPTDFCTVANSEVEVLGSYTNAYTNKWYKCVTESGQTYYAYGEYLEYVRPLDLKVTVSNFKPEAGAVLPPQSYHVQGTITSNVPLKQIDGYLDGEYYASWNASNKTTTTISIKETNLNTKLSFASLSDGTHTVTFRAIDFVNTSSSVKFFTSTFVISSSGSSGTTTYTISYNANGGSGAPGAQTKTHGTTLTLSSTKPTRAGYTFLGWSTSSTATSATYAAGGSYTVNASTTLYAVWKQNETSTTYTITYNANGGTGAPGAQTKTHGTTLTLSSTQPTRAGYTFLGWSTSSTATSATYAAGGSYTVNASTTLYAVWKATGGSSEAVPVGTVVEGALQLLYYNEGSYGSINKNDNGAVSIGKIQWHGNRALNLLKTIVKMDQAAAKSILGETLYNEINTSTNWSSRTVTEAEATALSTLLTTSNGKKAQDDLATSDVTVYINNGRNLGIQDTAALIYFADLENQGGYGMSSRVASAAANTAGSYGAVTLDTLHNAALSDSVAGSYKTRRDRTYSYCKDYIVGHVITFKPNGGTCATSHIVVNLGDPVGTLPDANFENMEFVGWFTAPYGGTEVTASTVPTGNMEVFAHYVNASTAVNLNFDTNGGTLSGPVYTATIDGVNRGRPGETLVVFNKSGTQPGTNIYGKEVAVNAIGKVTATREYGDENQLTVPDGGFILSGQQGWDSVAGVSTGGAMFVKKILAMEEAYVSLDYETGVVKVFDSYAGYLNETKTGMEWTTYGVLPVPTRDGYVFAGWNAGSSSNVNYYSGFAGMNLIAQWSGRNSISPVAVLEYNDHLYELYDYNVSWTEAKALCETMGGHLVTITDAAEQAQVTSLTAKGVRGLYSIGATDAGSEGSWKWVTGEAFSYNNWDKTVTEPSNGSGENYARIIAIENAPNKQVGEWVDDCNVFYGNFYDISNTGFICEYETSCDHCYSYSVIQVPKQGQTGVLRVRCTSCGKSTDSVLPVLNETDYEYRVTSAPTCKKTGVATYTWVVDEANEFYFEVEIPVVAHSYKSAYVEGTCGAYGYTTYTCDICGDSYIEYDEEGWSGWLETYPGDAEMVESRTEYCYREKEFTTNTSDSLNGWTLYETTTQWGDYGSWTSWSDTAVTTSETTKVETRKVYGYGYFLCSKCGAHMHGWGTCYTWAGGCGAATSESDWRPFWSTVSWDNAGLKDWHGTGKVYTYIDGQLVFKWADGGSKTQYRYCTRAQETVYSFYKWSEWSEWSATAVTANENREVQTRTTYRYYDDAIGSHAYEQTVTAPTCTEKGYTTHTCSVCGDSYVDTYVDALGHDVGQWTTVEDATCTEDGNRERQCSRCDYKETETIEAPGHDHKAVVTAPTCTENGYTTHTCSACGDSYVDTHVEKLGHSWNNATCTAAKTCGVCGATEGSVGDHNYENGSCIYCGQAEPGTGVDYLATGVCGANEDNLVWTLSADGQLTISGTGEMKDFQGTSYVPWAEYIEQITSVVIEEGVTSVGKFAFDNASALTEVSIPDTVATIGNYAFRNAVSLERCVLPEGIVTIPYEAFRGATALREITIPSSVTVIDQGAFRYTSNLETITLPSNLTTIEEDAFGTSGLTEIRIPDSVVSVGSSAFFRCQSLTKIDFGKGSASYGSSVFAECTKLEEVYISKNVATIGASMFEDCTALNKVVMESGITTIKGYAFYGCTALETVEMPDSIVTIGTHVFYMCQSLNNIELSENLTSIPEYCFYDCNALTSITVPGSVTAIGKGVFASCNGLKEITFCGDAPTMEDPSFERARIFYLVTANAYYPAGNTTWTTSNMHSYGGSITWIANGGEEPDEEIEITVNSTIASVTAPEGGWKEGTNTFTVAGSDACAVLISHDGGNTYVRLKANATEVANTYCFTAENVVAQTKIDVVMVGDSNGDGKVSAADITRLSAAYAGKTSLGVLQNFAGDANGDGKVSAADITKLSAAYAGKTKLTW